MLASNPLFAPFISAPPTITLRESNIGVPSLELYKLDEFTVGIPEILELYQSS